MEDFDLLSEFNYKGDDRENEQMLIGFVDIANEYITFRLGEELYAVEILKVKEIRSLMEITHVPKMPDYIKGVINLRGDIVPVIDLAIKLDYDEIEYGSFSGIIVVELDKRPIGILAEEVLDVMEIDRDRISKRIDVGIHVQSEFIEGIANINDRPMMILDIKKLLDLENIEAVNTKY